MKFSEKIREQTTPPKSGCSVLKIVQGDKKDAKKKKIIKPWEIKNK
jgi:hypothetical protein